MKYLPLVLIVGFSGAALADTSPDFVFFDAQIAALQHRVDASASSPGVTPEALTAMRGKQQELENQEAKLKTQGTITPDEKSALGISIREQQQRLGALTQAAQPRPVDPASLPPPTYVTPLGTTINAAPGVTPEQAGIIPLEPAPAMQIQTPSVAAPHAPVVHAPMPTTETPAQ